MGPPALPPLPRPRTRSALALNLLLPGAGLIRIGYPISGSILLSLFLISFAGVCVVFFLGYAHYLNALADGNIFEPGRLEGMAEGFRIDWLLGLGAVGVVIYVISVVQFACVRRQIGPAHRPDPGDRS